MPKESGWEPRQGTVGPQVNPSLFISVYFLDFTSNHHQLHQRPQLLFLQGELMASKQEATLTNVAGWLRKDFQHTRRRVPSHLSFKRWREKSRFEHARSQCPNLVVLLKRSTTISALTRAAYWAETSRQGPEPQPGEAPEEQRFWF